MSTYVIFHGVRGLTIGRSSGGDTYNSRNIIAVDKDGNKLEIVLFADRQNHLDLVSVDTESSYDIFSVARDLARANTKESKP